MLLALLLAVLPVQDDFSTWIARLGSESIEEREEATRRLQALGEAGVQRLEKARDAAQDPEVKARLEAILLRIRKAVELAKALGPTKRVTIAARGEPLKDILSRLKAPGVTGIDPGPFDPESRIDLNVRGVTWWEALDRAARAAGARYEIAHTDKGRHEISLVRGKEPHGPTVYVEQFRISVVEAKRYDYRTPSGNHRMAAIVVEARHQPDLKPGGRWHDDVIKFDSVTDAKGEDAKAPAPGWIGSTSLRPRPLGLQEWVWVRSEAVLPLTVTGHTDVSFPSETREVTLELAGEKSKAHIGRAVLQVAGFTSTPDRARLSLKAEMEEEDSESFIDRLVHGSVFLIDDKGARHEGVSTSSGGGGNRYTWRLEFSSGITGPRKVILRWVEEYYRVQLPFRLEGVKLPAESK